MQRLRSLLESEPSKRFFLCCFENLKRRVGFVNFQKNKYPFALTTKLRLRDAPLPSYLSGRITRAKRPFLNFIRPGFIQRNTSRWASSSLAANLSRNAGRRLFGRSSGITLSLVGFVLNKKPSILSETDELDGLSSEIRDAFSKLAEKNVESKLEAVPFSSKPKLSISNFAIGDLIAKGCNAAVYSAQWKKDYDESEPTESNKISKEKVEEKCTTLELTKTSDELIIPHSEDVSSVMTTMSVITVDGVHSSKLPIMPSLRFSGFDLVIKMMFNYSAQSDAFTIWKAMRKETLPALMTIPFEDSIGLRKKSRIPSHPNIVDMYCAFADTMPLLPKAMSAYPHALPVRLMQEGCGRNMTLFLVMKRYHCSLKDFLKNNEPSPQTSLLILCQLLEGLVHLRNNNVAHRDLKTDNILMDLTNGVSNPSVAITDFGCCLEGLKLPYTSEEVDRGGNLALMAPEVATAKPGPFSTIDYSQSDLWSLGCMAYEIFGVENPFYVTKRAKTLLSHSYNESELPELPTSAPCVVKKLVMDMLQKDPKLRPIPAVAATVCQLLVHAPPELLIGPFTKKEYQNITQWMFVMSAKTFLQAALKHPEVKTLQFQLCYTFCHRIRFTELLSALRYISNAQKC